jgi:hypothetical protein
MKGRVLYHQKEAPNIHGAATTRPVSFMKFKCNGYNISDTMGEEIQLNYTHNTNSVT